MKDDLEGLALKLLNSDRMAGGWPPVESRENIPDSDGYIRNAQVAYGHFADTIAALKAEMEEQCRLIGKGAEREAKLMAELEEARRLLSEVEVMRKEAGA